MIPTGYSFNLDGTSIYLTMAAVFIAQATNTPMTLTQQLTLLAVLLLTSKGAAGVTGSGFIVLAATLSAVGHVPVAGLALILGIDRFMSEARALTNLIGNGVATVVVAQVDRRARHRAHAARPRQRDGRRGRRTRRRCSTRSRRTCPRGALTAPRERWHGSEACRDDSGPGRHSSDAAPTAGSTAIVIVGGGAGGLELATRLGDTLGKRGQAAHVTLIDKNRTHFWKPKLHEIAAGSMDIGAYEVDYLAQAHWHHFRYRIGEMIGLDRERREVRVAPYVDEDGERGHAAARASATTRW